MIQKETMISGTLFRVRRAAGACIALTRSLSLRRPEDPLNAYASSVLSGAEGEFFTYGGQRDIDESFLVMMNAHAEDIDFRFPVLASPMSWEPLVDTAGLSGRVTAAKLYAPGETYPLKGRSFALFINRAPRPEGSRRALLATGAVLLDNGGLNSDIQRGA